MMESTTTARSDDRMRFKHLKINSQFDRLPYERLTGIVEEIINHPAARPPDTLGGYACSDLRKEAADFVKNLISKDNHSLVELTPEVVWLSFISRMDGKSNSEPAIYKRYAIPTVKLILANQIALESLVHKINGFMDEMEVARTEDDANTSMDLMPQALIPAFEAMKILGRIDMLEHVLRKESISQSHKERTLPVRERKKVYYGLARSFLLEENCKGKFSGEDEIADYLAKSPEFLERLCELRPQRSSWFVPEKNGKPAMIINEYFTNHVKTWGKVDDTHGGWSEFKKERQGRKK